MDRYRLYMVAILAAAITVPGIAMHMEEDTAFWDDHSSSMDNEMFADDWNAEVPFADDNVDAKKYMFSDQDTRQSMFADSTAQDRPHNTFTDTTGATYDSGQDTQDRSVNVERSVNRSENGVSSSVSLQHSESNTETATGSRNTERAPASENMVDSNDSGSEAQTRDNRRTYKYTEKRVKTYGNEAYRSNRYPRQTGQSGEEDTTGDAAADKIADADKQDSQEQRNTTDKSVQNATGGGTLDNGTQEQGVTGNGAERNAAGERSPVIGPGPVRGGGEGTRRTTSQDAVRLTPQEGAQVVSPYEQQRQTRTEQERAQEEQRRQQPQSTQTQERGGILSGVADFFGGIMNAVARIGAA